MKAISNITAAHLGNRAKQLEKSQESQPQSKKVDDAVTARHRPDLHSAGDAEKLAENLLNSISSNPRSALDTQVAGLDESRIRGLLEEE
ncbi:MAG: hypothetical protein KDD64_07810 [Bdellovibrionales bacterium]|nr:hypothetical protein [Bdellovibrionales bacterium]